MVKSIIQYIRDILHYNISHGKSILEIFSNIIYYMVKSILEIFSNIIYYMVRVYYTL